VSWAIAFRGSNNRLTNDTMASTSEQLQSRLASLSESLKGSQNLISRLAKLQIQPGSVTSTSDVPSDLTAEIQGQLREIEESLEILREDVDSFTTGNKARDKGENSRLEAGTARLEDDIRMYVVMGAL
jgi:protein transport protein SEC20